jgi:hypothetical protein
MNLSRSILMLGLGLIANPLRAGEEAERDFALKVLPILKEKCLACHGDKPTEIKGDFDMRSLKGMLQGGESGERDLVPGKPGESQIMVAIRRQDKDLSMPPKENDKLSIAQIRTLEKWIADGAVWPDEKKLASLAKDSSSWSTADGVLMKTSGGLSPEWTGRRYKPENLWAYQPVKKPATPGISAPRNPIDLLLAAKMESLDIQPGPPADRRTLLRRVTYDLTGLPPTPEEIDAFLKDSLPNKEAFAKVVERLLASPHYGEQWGRHWLDVVRYADTAGFANDYARGSAWRYRDYVVRAFNNDKPYDQFVIEQIAGDELLAEKSSPEPGTLNPELLVAPGFLRMGPWELTAMEVAKIARQRFLDDVTQSVGETFLGQALQCCRCHDHKFDPIPTRDYYSFQACFATTQLAERDAAFLPTENTHGFEERRDWEQVRQRHVATLKQLSDKSLAAADAWFKEKNLDRSRWDAAVKQASAGEPKGKKQQRRSFVGAFEGARTQLLKAGVPEDQYPPKQLGFSPEDFGRERIANKGLERMTWELDRYEPVALSVYSGVTPERVAVFAPQRMPANPMKDGDFEQEAILAGGDPFSPTQKVEPGVLSAVTLLQNSQAEIPNTITGRRLALARWIASKENPLTARTMVNRLWEWHFGQAIAGNPNNFGATGKKPTHPEVLDWLAATFMQSGWSVKAMQRLILSSEAYRRSCDYPDPKQLAAKDPEGISYAAFKPRRLTAEEFRDSMLSVSGELNPAVGGIPVKPEMNVEAAMQPRQVMGTFAEAWQPSAAPEERHRRSLYALKIRGLRDPFMEVFNEPNPDLSCERRDASTVSPQVFSLFNSTASYTRALAFADRLMKEKSDRPKKLERAFLFATGRPPRADEVDACVKHWDAMTERHRHLTFTKKLPPAQVTREAAEENTGQKFTFTETLIGADRFVPDISPADLDAETRGLAEVCLVLLNSNEFAYVY